MKYNLRNRFCISGLIILLLLTILPGTFALAKGTVNLPKASSGDSSSIGIDEKLGSYVPLDLTFYDESGKPLRLKDILNKPTVVTLVYYHCADVCNPLLSNVVDVLDRLQMEPGKDYSVITLSFDEKETPSVAFLRKKNYLAAFRRRFPEEAWKFLTGDSENIKKVTNAVGFRFKRVGDDFLHPASPIVALSSDGKIIWYLYGMSFLPFDLKMALTEASEGRVGFSKRKVLLFCYSYDPERRRYVFNILKAAGIATGFFIIVFFVYLSVKGKSSNKLSG